MDIGWMRRRFAEAAPPADTLYGDQDARPGAQSLRPACVLVPVVVRVPEPTVLFTRRTAHLKAHSGQISFPGGRVEPEDPTPEHTALRETQEEIGLAPERIELLGKLPEYHTRTGFRITPVIGVVTPPVNLLPDQNEVAEVFEVPLSFLMDPRNHQRHSLEVEGGLRWYFAIPYRDYYIWGATAGMLVNLHRYLNQR